MNQKIKPTADPPLIKRLAPPSDQKMPATADSSFLHQRKYRDYYSVQLVPTKRLH